MSERSDNETDDGVASFFPAALVRRFAGVALAACFAVSACSSGSDALPDATAGDVEPEAEAAQDAVFTEAGTSSDDAETSPDDAETSPDDAETSPDDAETSPDDAEASPDEATVSSGSTVAGEDLGEETAADEVEEVSDAPTEPVTPPGGLGDVTETVDARVQRELDDVELDDTVESSDGVTLAVASVNRFDAETEIPGEVGGPALLVTIEVANESGADIDLSSVTVTLFDGAGQVAGPLSLDPAEPFVGALADGETSTASYAFSFNDRPEPVTVEASVAPDRPIVSFTGAIS